MKFSEWWDKYDVLFKELGLTELQICVRDLKTWCSDAYNDGVTEGLRQAQVARSDPTQGGGSQTPCQGPQSCAFPCRAYETCKCKAGGA